MGSFNIYLSHMAYGLISFHNFPSSLMTRYHAVQVFFVSGLYPMYYEKENKVSFIAHFKDNNGM